MLPKTLSAFLWHFLRPYRTTFLGMVLSVLLYSLLTAASPYLLKLIIDKATTPLISPQGLLSAVFMPAILFVILYQIMDFCWIAFDFFRLKTLPKFRADIINIMFSYLQDHSYSYFQKNFTGTLANKISDMARSAESVIAQIVEPIFAQTTALLVAVTVMYFINPMFSVILFSWAFLFLGVGLLFYKSTLNRATLFSELNSLSMGKLVDSVTNIVSAKLFARNVFEREYLSRYVKESKEKDEELQWHMLKLKIFQGISVTFLFGCMVSGLIYAKERNLVTIGDFAFVLSLSTSIMQGLWYLVSHFLTFFQELGICQQALSIINIPHEIVDKPNAKKLRVTQGEIVFDKVTFNYEKGKNVFKDKSLKIKGGQKVGLVGFSGSGKTTFASLILRFFDVKQGQILIDHQNITEVTQNSLHAQIAMIPQDPILFHRSLLENIRYGKLEATDAEVMEASKKAHCHEFIQLLPDGYHTMVGERGLKLSGGQRQRIAIARAILKNAPILILDEATSALDSMTEKKIRESLKYLMQNRTTIVIAHRLSTLTDMNRILVFMGGQVVEDGTHEELLKYDGHYAKLWEMQAGGFLPERLEGREEEISEEEAIS